MKMLIESKDKVPMLNVYRTKKFIVEQQIYLDYLPDGSTVMFSNDIYYKRTHSEDRRYEKKYNFRENINGKRIYVGLYKRSYC